MFLTQGVMPYPAAKLMVFLISITATIVSAERSL
jgi:hypothetical protein